MPRSRVVVCLRSVVRHAARSSGAYLRAVYAVRRFAFQPFGRQTTLYHSTNDTLSDAGFSGFYLFQSQFLAFTYVKFSVMPAQPTFNQIYVKLTAIPGVTVMLAEYIHYADRFDWFAINWEHVSIPGVGYNYMLGDTVGFNVVQAPRLIPQRFTTVRRRGTT